MPGLVPGIHVLKFDRRTWIAGTKPGHDRERIEFTTEKNQTGCRMGNTWLVLGKLKKLLEVPMSKIAPCLWFDGEAEEAARFYVSLLPDSRIDRIQKNLVDGPAGKAGTVLVVQFTLAGQEYMALNGGTRFEYTPAISFKIDCADQAEVDRLWDALSANGGQVERCGWLKDRYGVSWQIVPSVFLELLGGPDRAGAERAMKAVMQMAQHDI